MVLPLSASVPLPLPGLMRWVARESVARPVGVAAHPVVWQGADLLTGEGIWIRVLRPPVAQQYERARPPRRRRSELTPIEAHPDAVAGAENDIAIVDLLQ